MHWIQSKLPELPVGNFTTDWSSGKAVGALVDSVAPGLCPDWDVSSLIYTLASFIIAINIL